MSTLIGWIQGFLKGTIPLKDSEINSVLSMIDASSAMDLRTAFWTVSEALKEAAMWTHEVYGRDGPAGKHADMIAKNFASNEDSVFGAGWESLNKELEESKEQLAAACWFLFFGTFVSPSTTHRVMKGEHPVYPTWLKRLVDRATK